MKIDEKTLERHFKALANHRRLSILRLLKSRKNASVGETAEHIRLSFKATSKHLGILYAAGLVERKQLSLMVQYSVSGDIIEPLKSSINML